MCRGVLEIVAYKLPPSHGPIYLETKNGIPGIWVDKN